MKKNPQKMILVDEELHRQLLITKSMKSFKSLSDVIKYYVKKDSKWNTIMYTTPMRSGGVDTLEVEPPYALRKKT